MGAYAEEVLEACQKISIEAHIEPPSVSRQLRTLMRQRYGGGKITVSEWEGLTDVALIQDPNGWQQIGRLLGERSVFMFFEPERDEHGIWIQKGGRVSDILADCTGFEFYVVNETVDFVISFTRYDLLVGAGEAKAWIETLKTPH